MTLVNDSLLNAFFTTGFEEEAVLPGSGKVLIGHFYDKYESAKILDQDAESSLPLWECKAADIQGVKQKDEIVIRAQSFFIHEIQKDGEGFAKITLTYD